MKNQRNDSEIYRELMQGSIYLILKSSLCLGYIYIFPFLSRSPGPPDVPVTDLRKKWEEQPDYVTKTGGRLHEYQKVRKRRRGEAIVTAPLTPEPDTDGKTD